MPLRAQKTYWSNNEESLRALKWMRSDLQAEVVAPAKEPERDDDVSHQNVIERTSDLTLSWINGSL
jgi:hypothetical protein